MPKITNTSKIVQSTKTQTIGQKECKNNWYKFDRSSWRSQSGILIFEGHGTPPSPPPLPWCKDAQKRRQATSYKECWRKSEILGKGHGKHSKDGKDKDNDKYMGKTKTRMTENNI